MIEIYYDLVKRLEDANEKFGPLKLVKKHIKSVTGSFGGFLAIACSIGLPTTQVIIGAAVLPTACALILAGQDVWNYKFYGGDVEQWMAKEDIAELSLKLCKHCISTSPDLLLESEQQGKTRYKIVLNKHRIPVIRQEKCVMIPTYDNGNIRRNVSVIQEHIIGSKKYVLTPGTPSESKSKTRLLKPIYDCI